MPKIGFRHGTGFTLIEVLVSMIILALGLLGLVALQGLSLKNNQDAFSYSQANILAYEMSDRIKANRLAWIGAAIPAPAAACAAGCDAPGAVCNSTDMAAFDYCYWQNTVTNRLLQGATATVTRSPVANSTVCTSNAPALCLRVTWSRTNQDLGKQAGRTGLRTASFDMEVTP